MINEILEKHSAQFNTSRLTKFNMMSRWLFTVLVTSYRLERRELVSLKTKRIMANILFHIRYRKTYLAYTTCIHENVDYISVRERIKLTGNKTNLSINFNPKMYRMNVSYLHRLERRELDSLKTKRIMTNILFHTCYRKTYIACTTCMHENGPRTFKANRYLTKRIYRLISIRKCTA